MNLNTRSIGLAVLSLLFFLGAAVALQAWLRRETRQLHNLAIEEQRERLGRIIVVSGLPPERWNAAFERELGAIIGGTVRLVRQGDPAPASAPPASSLSFTAPLASAPGWEARVVFATPALIRVQVLHQRILATV